MNRCPITYQECGAERYSQSGLRSLSINLKEDLEFPYSAKEQIEMAAEYSDKLSIQGVQPKVSVRLNVRRSQFEPIVKGGTYIIKPEHPFYPELPQNEDVTMRLAALVGVDVPPHGLVYSKGGTLSYFIKRFDRYGHGKKLAVEDFAQLSGHNRDTKYESSMEKLIPILEAHCSFPELEKLRLFRLTLFCFLVGNEDMHLKNLSLIRRKDKVEMTPAYDLLNSSLVVRSKEELALPLQGKRSRLSRVHLVDYFGGERLGLNSAVLQVELEKFRQVQDQWMDLLDLSFLSEAMREKYKDLILQRWARIE
jgi:serine/threonine-protein kinase HipA